MAVLVKVIQRSFERRSEQNVALGGDQYDHPVIGETFNDVFTALGRSPKSTQLSHARPGTRNRLHHPLRHADSFLSQSCSRLTETGWPIHLQDRQYDVEKEHEGAPFPMIPLQSALAAAPDYAQEDIEMPSRRTPTKVLSTRPKLNQKRP
jgi:hypothetical protein